MTSDQLAVALAAVADRLVAFASDNDAFRADLQRLAQAILQINEPREQQLEAIAEKPAGKPQDETVCAEEDVQESMVGVQSSPPGGEILPLESPAALPALTLGQSGRAAEPPAIILPRKWTAPPDDLSLIENRCRLKAEGTRWATRRQRLIVEGASYSNDIEPKDREIIARAKAVPNCFLWMCHPSAPYPKNPDLYESVAGCFEAVADAVAIVRQISNEPDIYRDEYEDSLDLLAEAQSALRVAVAQIDGTVDSDQTQVHNWLKMTANENQIFIRRHMRVDDPADPSSCSDIISRLELLDARVQEIRQHAKQLKKLLGKVRHKVSLITKDPQNAEGHWETLITTVDELVSIGLPPSNRELRELLIPAVEYMPELANSSSTFESVLREIDRYLSIRPTPESVVASPPTPEVQEAAKLLKGSSMVLIGGDRRPSAQQAIKDAFALQDLIWIATREHQSIDVLEPYVARPDVAVVVLAIRWASHSFGDVQDFCDRHGKPLVRLPAGYNPNQVAIQIMQQASRRLKER